MRRFAVWVLYDSILVWEWSHLQDWSACTWCRAISSGPVCNENTLNNPTLRFLMRFAKIKWQIPGYTEGCSDNSWNFRLSLDKRSFTIISDRCRARHFWRITPFLITNANHIMRAHFKKEGATLVNICSASNMIFLKKAAPSDTVCWSRHWNYVVRFWNKPSRNISRAISREKRLHLSVIAFIRCWRYNTWNTGAT